MKNGGESKIGLSTSSSIVSSKSRKVVLIQEGHPAWKHLDDLPTLRNSQGKFMFKSLLFRPHSTILKYEQNPYLSL